jgi:hypothetical protein
VIILGQPAVPGTGSAGSISPVFGYEGAGTGLCTQNTQPTVLSEDQLNRGEY